MSVLPVIDGDEIKYNNYPVFPNHYRCLTIGESGGGKTVLINELILSKMLDWDILYLYTPSILQPSYQVLIKGINAGLLPIHVLGIYSEQDNLPEDPMKYIDTVIERLTKELKTVQTHKVIGHKDPGKMIKPEKLSKEAYKKWSSLPCNKDVRNLRKPKTIVLIDDAICSSQTAINKMFVYGRTFGINIIYLTQAFFASSKGQARTNTNVFFLYRQSDDDLKRIYARVNKGEKTFDEFSRLAKDSWSKPFGFILIVRKSDETCYYSCDEIRAEYDKRTNFLRTK